MNRILLIKYLVLIPFYAQLHGENSFIIEIYFTSPAPWNKITLSDNLVLVIRREAKRPARATEAVP